MHIAPSPVTYNAVIHLCAELGALAEAEELEEDLDGLYGTNSYSLGCIFLGYILVSVLVVPPPRGKQALFSHPTIVFASMHRMDSMNRALRFWESSKSVDGECQ